MGGSKNNIDVVNAFIAHKNIAVLNAVNNQGKTALILTCEYNNDDEIVNSLIDCFLSIDPTALNTVDISGRNALMYAAMNEMVSVVNRLIHHYNINTLNIEDPLAKTAILFAGAINGHMDVFNYVLPHLDDSELNTVNQLGKTALMCAAMQGNTAILNKLLDEDKKANITTADEEGVTALILAADRGHAEIVKALTTHLKPADLNKQDNEGNSALIIAVQKGYFTIVEILLSQGADANLNNNEQHNALMIASNSNDRNITYRILSALKGEATYIQTIPRLNFMNREFKSLVIASKKWIFESLWIFNKIPGFNYDITSKIVSNKILHPGWYHHLIEDNVKSILEILDRKLVDNYKKANISTPQLTLVADVISNVPPVEPVTLSRPKRKRGGQIQIQESETRYPKRTNRSFKGAYSK